MIDKTQAGVFDGYGVKIDFKIEEEEKESMQLKDLYKYDISELNDNPHIKFFISSIEKMDTHNEETTTNFTAYIVGIEDETETWNYLLYSLCYNGIYIKEDKLTEVAYFDSWDKSVKEVSPLQFQFRISEEEK